MDVSINKLIAVVLGSFLVVTLTPPAAHAADQLSDGHRVYCMSQANRTQLLETVNSLGLSQPKGTTTLEEWAADGPEQFSRVCRALVASRVVAQAPSSSTQSTGQPQLLNTLASTVLGALLTLTTSYWVRSRDRRRKESEALTAALTAFGTAVREYLARWAVPTVAGIPPTQELQLTKLALLRQISRLQSLGVGRFPVSALLSVLNGASFGTALTSGWDANDPPLRRSRGEQLETLLVQFEEDVVALGEKVVQPSVMRMLWPQSKLASANQSVIPNQ